MGFSGTEDSLGKGSMCVPKCPFRDLAAGLARSKVAAHLLGGRVEGTQRRWVCQR